MEKSPVVKVHAVLLPVAGDNIEWHFDSESAKAVTEDLIAKMKELEEAGEALQDWFAIQILITREY